MLSSARGVITSGASSATSWVGTSSSVDGVAAVIFDVVAMGIRKVWFVFVGLPFWNQLLLPMWEHSSFPWWRG